MGKATINQLNYAYAIADKLGLERPADDYEICHSFIARNKPLYDKVLRFNIMDNIDSDSYDEYMDIFCYRDLQKDYGRKAVEWTVENLSKKAGVYCFISGGKIAYIGKSLNLANRIPSSYTERKRELPIDKILYYLTPTKADASILEMLLIAENKPILNTDGNTRDKPIMFKSNIDILKDFKELQIN